LEIRDWTLEVGEGIAVTWVGVGGLEIRDWRLEIGVTMGKGVGAGIGGVAQAVRKKTNSAMKNLKRAVFRICME